MTTSTIAQSSKITIGSFESQEDALQFLERVKEKQHLDLSIETLNPSVSTDD